jgi:hypothetical protein
MVLELAQGNGAALVGNSGTRIDLDRDLDVGIGGEGYGASIAAEYLARLEV